MTNCSNGTADVDTTAGNRHRAASAAALTLILAGSLVLFDAIWHRTAVWNATEQPGGWIGAIVIVAFSAIIHEFLHALGWIAASGMGWRAVTFRPTWRKFGITARLTVAVPAAAYRAGTLLPILVLGILPMFIGLASGHGLVLLWALFFLLECFADITLLLATATVPAGLRVLEHSSKIGWHVINGWSKPAK